MKQGKKNNSIGCFGAFAILLILGLITALPRVIQIITGLFIASSAIYYFVKKYQENKKVNNRSISSSQQTSPPSATTSRQSQTNSKSNANITSNSQKSFDFVAIDFETANEKRNSACSIGIAAVKGLSVVEEKSWLIKPPTNEFKNINIRIHGITADQVKDAPDFKSLWNNQIKYYIERSSFIIAHNTSFDINVIKSCFQYYAMPPLDFRYFDSMNLLQRFEPLPRYGLKEAARHFNISMQKHHDAQSDATTAAKIVIEILERNHLENIFTVERQYPILFHSFLEYYRSNKTNRQEKHKSTKSKNQIFREFYANTAVNYDALVYPSSIDDSMPLYNKSFCFTGVLNMSRQEAIQSVINRGGIIRKGSGKTLDYLVVGAQDNRIVGDDGMSRKEEIAIQNNKEGSHIKIINENEFMEILDE